MLLLIYSMDNELVPTTLQAAAVEATWKTKCSSDHFEVSQMFDILLSWKLSCLMNSPLFPSTELEEKQKIFDEKLEQQKLVVSSS